ncbi:hypothetical protein KR009_009770, partial [Drosophila setifemur]
FSKLEFTNIKCTSLDPEFCDFEYCYLKSVNRSYKYLSLKVKLYKLPITKIKVCVYYKSKNTNIDSNLYYQMNLELQKRTNGYKPFLYNITVDACRYMRNPKSNPIAAYLHGLFLPFSNMNHTCPYNHDLMVEKVSTSFINTQVTSVLPFPLGDFLLLTKWIAYDIHRATVSVYATLS